MDCDVDEELRWNFSCRFTQHPKLAYNLTITLNSNSPVVQSKKKPIHDQLNRQLCVTVEHLRDKTQKWSGTWNEKFIEQMTNRGGCKLSLKGFAYLLCLGCQHLNMESDTTLNFVNFNSLSLNLFFPAQLGLETVATNSIRQVTDKLYLILSWRKNEKSSAWHFPLPLLLNSSDLLNNFVPSLHLQTKRYDDEMALQEGALQKLKAKISNLKKHLEQEKKKTDSSKSKQSVLLKKSKTFTKPSLYNEPSTLLSSFLSDSSLSSLSSQDAPTTSNVAFPHYATVINGVELKPLQNVKSPEITCMREALRRSRSLSRTLMSLNSRSPCTTEKAKRVNSTRTTCGALQDTHSNVLTKSCRVERKMSKNIANQPCFFRSLNGPPKAFSAKSFIPCSTTFSTDKKHSSHSLIKKNTKMSQSDVFTISFNNVRKTNFYRTPSVVVQKPFLASQVWKTKQDMLKPTNEKHFSQKCSTRENQDNARRFSEKVLLKASNNVMFPEKHTRAWFIGDTCQKTNKSSLTPMVSKKKKIPSSLFLNKKATTVLEKQRFFSQSLNGRPCLVHLKTERSRQGTSTTSKEEKNVPLRVSTIYPKLTKSLLKRNVSCGKVSEFLSTWKKSSHAWQENEKLECESTDTSEDSYGEISQRIFALQKKLENVKHY